MEIRTQVPVADWKTFLENCSDSTVFHTPEIMDFFEATKKYSPYNIFILNNGKILGMLSGVRIVEFNNFFNFITSRNIIYGYPIALGCNHNSFIIEKLLSYHKDFISPLSIYDEIRNVPHIKSHLESYEKLNYQREIFHNILVNLKVDKEYLWENLSQSKRRSIRKFNNKNFIIVEAKNKSQIREFHSIVAESYIRIRKPYPNLDFFENALEYLSLKGKAKIWLAYDNQDCLGGIFSLIYKKEIYEWYICTTRTKKNNFASEMCTWYPIEWGQKKGFHFFDFGGAGKVGEKYGVRNFKSQFGGDDIQNSRFLNINYPLIKNTIDFLLKVYSKI